MAGFGVKMSSAVGGEGKTLSPDPKQTAEDEARAPMGLLTPESTPGPDTARLKADKARRQAEAAKAVDVMIPESPSGVDTAVTTVDKGKGPVKPSQTAVPLDASPDGASNKGQRKYTDKQKNTVKRVLKCEPTKYYQILGVEDPSTKREVRKAYKELSLLLHTDKNKYEGAEEAFRLVATAAEALGVESEDFTENGYGAEDGTDDGSNATDLEQGVVLKPDDFRKKIYEEATTYLGKLMEDPKDAGAKLELEKLNNRIKEQNLRDKLPKKDLENFLVQIPTFIANFEMAQGYCKALWKDPEDDMAREKLTNMNNTLRQLNERHGYPDTWLITLPDTTGPKGAESSGAAASKNADKAGQASTKGGVKTKIGVPIPDMSDGRTSLGKVQYVRIAGTGSRVIVNRGTDQNPYFDVYPGGEFGRGVAKQWVEEKMYQCKDLPKDTTAANMTIYGRVKVKKTNQKRENKTGRTQSQIQFYLVRVMEEEYVIPRTALSRMKGLSPAILKRIDAQLDRQNEHLLAELDECREQNEHPDTGEQLTKADIDEMPWLSPDAIPQAEDDEDNDEDEEDNGIGNIVPQRTGLKRSAKPKAASGTPEASRTSRYSVDSEL